MGDKGRAVLDVAKKPGNDVCADCPSKCVEYASYNVGVFLCPTCAGFHRGLGVHISKVKHLRLDHWEDSQIRRLEEVGNLNARRKYEERVPACYRRPSETDPSVLRDQWIRAKYEREEFIHPERQMYTRGSMEGYLMKRGKDGDQCKPRRFVLNEMDDSLRYFIKDRKDPKAVIRISTLNVVCSPEKVGVPTSLQFTFPHGSSARHIYVYHENAETVIQWYMALRCSKLNRLMVAYPSACESALVDPVMHDFLREGWLIKSGPKQSDAYRKRWFSLDRRRLMYHETKLEPMPKGDIFLGHRSEGFSVRLGSPAGFKDTGFSFTLITPDRQFLLSSDKDDDRYLWMKCIDSVLDREVTFEDSILWDKIRRGT